MKIIHRFSKNYGKNMDSCHEAISKLRSFGIECNISVLPLVIFDIHEQHEFWDEVITFVENNNMGSPYCNTEFTKKEKNSASYLKLYSIWPHGYPMPDDDFGYMDITYKPGIYCKNCDVGKIQQAPFRMRLEPKWGTRHVMRLNWVNDELFVRREVWQTIFRPLGVDCIPVIHHTKKMELESVVQLKIDQISPVPLKTDGLDFEVCPECCRKRYKYIERGFFPEFDGNVNCDIVKTQEHFGTGHSANRAIIISNKIYRIIQDNKLKGFDYTPMGSREGLKDIKI